MGVPQSRRDVKLKRMGVFDDVEDGRKEERSIQNSNLQTLRQKQPSLIKSKALSSKQLALLPGP